MQHITTLKVKKSTKIALDHYKKSRETYDDVLKKLLACVEKRSLKNKLIHAYKSNAERDQRLVNEWESASHEVE